MGQKSWNIIESIFKELGYEYLRQGSLASADDYPESFFTFWNIGNDGITFYDDDNHHIESIWSICSYTCKPELMYSMLDSFILKAKEKKFIIGSVTDVLSDRPDYFGRNVSVTILIS